MRKVDKKIQGNSAKGAKASGFFSGKSGLWWGYGTEGNLRHKLVEGSQLRYGDAWLGLKKGSNTVHYRAGLEVTDVSSDGLTLTIRQSVRECAGTNA